MRWAPSPSRRLPGGAAVLRLVFGPAYLLSRRDLALLAASCAALMAAQALGQG